MPATLATLTTDRLLSHRNDLVRKLRNWVTVTPGAKSTDEFAVETSREIRTINTLLHMRSVLNTINSEASVNAAH